METRSPSGAACSYRVVHGNPAAAGELRRGNDRRLRPFRGVLIGRRVIPLPVRKAGQILRTVAVPDQRQPRHTGHQQEEKIKQIDQIAIVLRHRPHRIIEHMAHGIVEKMGDHGRPKGPRAHRERTPGPSRRQRRKESAQNCRASAQTGWPIPRWQGGCHTAAEARG